MFTFRDFQQVLKDNKARYRRFLSKLEKAPPRGLDKLTSRAEGEVWKEVECLSCANCCKTMTPTFTPADIRRISAHFNMTQDEFKKKWLRQERGGNRDWLNVKQPCQFLNLEDNKCSIYEIRPVDCAGFPHLPKKKMVDYIHIHKQNIEYCPATYKMVEKIKGWVEQSGKI